MAQQEKQGWRPTRRGRYGAKRQKPVPVDVEGRLKEITCRYCAASTVKDEYVRLESCKVVARDILRHERMTMQYLRGELTADEVSQINALSSGIRRMSESLGVMVQKAPEGDDPSAMLLGVTP